MKVILDASQVYHTNEHGYKYFKAMLPRLRAHPELTLEIIPSPVGLVGEAPAPTAAAKRLIPQGQLRSWLGARKRQMAKLLWRMRREDVHGTLFHSTYYTLPPVPEMALLTTMHDLIAEKFAGEPGFPRDASFLLRKERCVRQAKHLLAVSETTKRDLCAWYGVPPNRTSVVPMGADVDFFSAPHSPGDEQALRERLGLGRPYVLQVGGRLHHKNFPRLVEAWAASPLRRDMTLVAAGEPLEDAERELLARFGVATDVVNVVRPDEGTLRLLYRCAAMLVYPSLYEGFGIPPIEAMASGTPVAAARAGSIPEVCGDAARFFDPRSPSEIAAALEALADPKEADAFRARGTARARNFSWDVTAEGTFQVYLKLLTHTLLDREGLSL